jgi:hypothetical protein
MTDDLSFEAMAFARREMASRMDLAPGDVEFRTELHMLGALETWFLQEGLDTSDPESFSYDNRNVLVNYRGNSWLIGLRPSTNFPDVEKLFVRVLVASVPSSESTQVLTLLAEVCPPNPHFSIAVIPGEKDAFFISASAMVGAEPKDMQLAIGVAMNDLISYASPLADELSRIPGYTMLYRAS